jgi:hypothetical protein
MAILIALGQFAKLYVPARYIPIITLVLGVVAGYYYIPNAGVQEAIFNGVALGLSANGLFDLTKLLQKK